MTSAPVVEVRNGAAPARAATMLSVHDINTFYGHIHALKGVSLAVEQGEIVTLIGSNGAGKSTTLNTVAGLLTPKTGTIELNGRSIAGVPAHKVATMGVAMSPEGRRIFPRMSVLENLEMGAFTRGRPDPADMERVFDLFPRLKERIAQKAGTMSGGEQQMLAMGRALMAHPSLLLLDEPSMGLAPQFIQQIFNIISEINQQGTTVLLVEQNAQQALSRANRGYVLETGSVTRSSAAGDLLADPAVKEAYLGIA
jgi:branched-chain amino acid transport system ATP-binding protein